MVRFSRERSAKYRTVTRSYPAVVRPQYNEILNKGVGHYKGRLMTQKITTMAWC